MENLIEEKIAKYLVEKGQLLATAESCTGGLISHRITNIDGSSRYYLGSIIAYANEVKQNSLGVQVKTLEKFGAVSEETVSEMAKGIRHALAADIGLSVSGIAGPTGGTPEKPVGYAWIGLSTPQGICTLQHNAGGNRIENKEEVAQVALEFLHNFLSTNGKD